MNVKQRPLALFIRFWRLARGLGRRTLCARGLGRHARTLLSEPQTLTHAHAVNLQSRNVSYTHRFLCTLIGPFSCSLIGPRLTQDPLLPERFNPLLTQDPFLDLQCIFMRFFVTNYAL